MWAKLRLDPHHSRERIQRWLSQTRDSPLDLILHGDDKRPYLYSHSGLIVSFVPHISHHLARTIHLTVDLGDTDELSEVQSKLLQPLRSLRRLGHLRSMRVRCPLGHPLHLQPGGMTLIEPLVSSHRELRVLILYRCALDWEWPMQNLKVFRLVKNLFSRAPHPPAPTCRLRLLSTPGGTHAR